MPLCYQLSRMSTVFTRLLLFVRQISTNKPTKAYQWSELKRPREAQPAPQQSCSTHDFLWRTTTVRGAVRASLSKQAAITDTNKIPVAV